MIKWIALLLAIPGLALAKAPSGTTCVTSKQMRHYQTVSGPKLSPDGRNVVWVQHESTADGAATHLWMAPVDGSSPARQLTFSAASDKAGESSPAWMPDGSAILFVAKRGKQRQIFRLPLKGGEAAPITLETDKLPLSPGQFEISPDGRWLAFSAKQPKTKQEKKDKKDKKDVVVVGQDKHPARVWLYSFADKRVTALTPLTREAHGFAWSPDSSKIAIRSGVARNHGELPPNDRLEIVSVAHPDRARAVHGVPPTIRAFAFSPDGRHIGFLAQSEHDTPPGVSDVYVIPVHGGTPRNVSGASDFTIDGQSIAWKNDGSAIYVRAQHGTSTALLAFPLAGGGARWQPAAVPVVSDIDSNRRQSGWVFVAQSSTRLPQVVYAHSPSAPGKVLSHANEHWASSGWRRAMPVSWQGPDHVTIHGLYFKPASCPGGAPDIGGKSPMILVAHGGPTGAFVQRYDLFAQWLTSQGWAVLEVNPRGSTGYGWQFTAANRNDLGGKDFRDEMAGVDWTLAHEPVDAKRLGMFGYSYGGEMAVFIEGKTDRFAAIVSGAPVTDQYSEYGTEKGPYYDEWFFGRPWKRSQDAWRQSGLAYAKHARTPLLLLQGQKDRTDPVGQSEEEYRALFEDGVPVRLVTFPREDHLPLAKAILGFPSHEPWHGFEGRAQILAWYRDHFQKRMANDPHRKSP